MSYLKYLLALGLMIPSTLFAYECPSPRGLDIPAFKNAVYRPGAEYPYAVSRQTDGWSQWIITVDLKKADSIRDAVKRANSLVPILPFTRMNPEFFGKRFCEYYHDEEVRVYAQ